MWCWYLQLHYRYSGCLNGGSCCYFLGDKSSSHTLNWRLSTVSLVPWFRVAAIPWKKLNLKRFVICVSMWICGAGIVAHSRSFNIWRNLLSVFLKFCPIEITWCLSINQLVFSRLTWQSVRAQLCFKGDLSG